PHQPDRSGRVHAGDGTLGDPVDERVVGEAGEREVEVDGHRLRRVLALRGRPSGPVQLLRTEPQQGRLLLALPGLGDVLEQPAHPERHRLLRERRGQPDEPAAPAPPPLPSGVRTLTQTSAGAGGAPSASTWVRALSSSSTPCVSSSPSGLPRTEVRPAPRAFAAWALTTAGRRSASTRTTPQLASSSRASLSAMERSRSIWACTSLNAQYTPA